MKERIEKYAFFVKSIDKDFCPERHKKKDFNRFFSFMG
jgi:hypothetical protein